MKMSFFPKLAWTGIKNNRKLYIPYLLTCIGMVMMQYINDYLSHAEVLSGIPGGRTLQGMLALGVWIIAIFAFFFLNYSNSFLMRRRRKEFGLYNILGMGKTHISIVLLWETLLTAVIALVFGLFGGVTLSKAAELIMVNIMGGEIIYDLTFSLDSFINALTVYTVIFGFIMLRALWQLRKTSAIGLLKSENAGEKLQRLYWLWGFLGVIVLGAAYFIAVSIKDPISALVMFFVAVGMVIVATYLLFTSGSVLLCKLLQKNKAYYYKASHFVSVSSMTYRMTRTGAGLASICILLTMVLVMLSATSCLYFGVDDALNSRYPRELMINVYMVEADDADEGSLQTVRNYLNETITRHGIEPENIVDHRLADISGQLFGTELELDPTNMKVNSPSLYEDVRWLSFVPLSDYNRMTGRNCTLAADEILIYPFKSEYNGDTLSIRGTDLSFRVKEHLDSFPTDGSYAVNVVSTIFVVVPDYTETLAPLMEMRTEKGGEILEVHWTYGFDTDADVETQIALFNDLKENLPDDKDIGMEGGARFIFECRERERNDFMGTFAGLFALGAILSVVFLFAAVLMIYYKQITEGYEDQNRFDIMQKVGMTKKDIRKSINSQMLTVFLLPLLTAGLHLCFAFPMIRMLLLAFSMTNTMLFVQTCLISFAVFGLFYVIVYRITSNAYYSIVSGAKEEA